MPVRSFAATSFFDPEFVAPQCLQPGTLPWVLARCRTQWFAAWLFADWRGHCRRGRKAWPAVVLLTLLLLRWSEQGMGRRTAVRRAATDATWRAAMGLAFGDDTPSERTVRDFERFLLQRHGDTHVPRYLLVHEHIVRACLEAGVVAAPPAWAMDSTPMWCYGAVRDTVRLLGDGLRMLAGDWARATRQRRAEVAAAWDCPFLLAKSTKGAFSVEWREPGAASTAITHLAEAVLQAVTRVRGAIPTVRAGLRTRLLRRCRQLVRVITCDLETDAQGHLVVAQRVAADRLVSITDPEARHGRKSKSQTFEGFKIHVLGDVLSGLVMAVAVTHGNAHDSVPAHRLIRRAQQLYGKLGQVLADTAYGGARLRHVVRRLEGVELLAPPPPVNGKEGTVGKRELDIDFDAGKYTCAGGVVTEIVRHVWSSEHGVHVPCVVWPTAACDACPLSGKCRGKEKGGRRILLHPYERELRAAREVWRNPATRTTYRTRSQCERLVNQLTRYGGRQARAFGLGAAQLQAHLIAMRSNLCLLATALLRKRDEGGRAAAAV